eukprot:Selendium_serpulae@DN6652_c0_g1_i1.p1
MLKRESVSESVSLKIQQKPRRECKLPACITKNVTDVFFADDGSVNHVRPSTDDLTRLCLLRCAAPLALLLLAAAAPCGGVALRAEGPAAVHHAKGEEAVSRQAGTRTERRSVYFAKHKIGRFRKTIRCTCRS